MHYQINLKFIVTCFVLGAILGTTGDFVHVITKTDGYPADGPFPFLPFLPVSMPVWVPFLFGGAVVLMGITQRLFSVVYTPRFATSRFAAIASPLFFLLVYALSGFVNTHSETRQNLWLALVAISTWYVADRTLTGMGLAALTALAGTTVEIFLVHIHAFYYWPAHADFFGVPSWLPWLYVVASLCAGLFTRIL
jgi:hypothetical protein